jgi:chemotaxis protein MotB
MNLPIVSLLSPASFVRTITGVVLALGLTLGGCNKVPRAEFDSALTENDELRLQNQDLQTQLAEINTRNASLEQENRDLNSRSFASTPNTNFTPGGTGGTGGFGAGAETQGTFGPGTTTSTRGSDVVVGVAGDVLFDSGKTTLKTTSKRTLDRIAAALNGEYARNEIRIEGYTDSDPIKKSQWKTNERLSSERALAVEEYLQKQGVTGSRMYVAGFGAANPKSSKKDSRRVEIVILNANN